MARQAPLCSGVEADLERAQTDFSLEDDGGGRSPFLLSFILYYVVLCHQPLPSPGLIPAKDQTHHLCLHM